MNAANMDEALRCLDMARRRQTFGDSTEALRLVRKSLALCPTEDGRRMEVELSGGTSSRAPPSGPQHGQPQGNGQGDRQPYALDTATAALRHHFSDIGIAPQYHLPIVVVYTAALVALGWRVMGYGPLQWMF